MLPVFFVTFPSNVVGETNITGLIPFFKFCTSNCYCRFPTSWLVLLPPNSMHVDKLVMLLSLLLTKTFPYVSKYVIVCMHRAM